MTEKDEIKVEHSCSGAMRSLFDDPILPVEICSDANERLANPAKALDGLVPENDRCEVINIELWMQQDDLNASLSLGLRYTETLIGQEGVQRVEQCLSS